MKAIILTVVIVAVIVAACAAAVVQIIINKKKGKHSCSCGGNCGACPVGCSCGTEKDKSEK